MIKLRVLRWGGDYTGLSWWTLNSITRMLIKGTWIHKLFGWGRPNPSSFPSLLFSLQSPSAKGCLHSWVTKLLRTTLKQIGKTWSQKIESPPWIVLHLPPHLWERKNREPWNGGSLILAIDSQTSQTGRESKLFMSLYPSLLPKHNSVGLCCCGDNGGSSELPTSPTVAENTNK